MLSSAGNIGLVLAHDPGLAGRLRRDVEGDAIYAVGETLPWRRLPRGCSLWGDGDDANLRIYLETRYGIVNKAKVDDAVSHFADAAPYDPLGEHLASLPEWDAVSYTHLDVYKRQVYDKSEAQRGTRPSSLGPRPRKRESCPVSRFERDRAEAAYLLDLEEWEYRRFKLPYDCLLYTSVRAMPFFTMWSWPFRRHSSWSFFGSSTPLFTNSSATSSSVTSML